jgi:hypothetical protein
MSSLIDLQDRVHLAVTNPDSSAVTLPLIGGTDARKRLIIHQRHYQVSLTTAIREKFPATAWLVGEGLVDDAAGRYVRAHPPERPCIAEYGETFPAFLARQPRAADLPYVQNFAELEWHLGHVSIAVDRPPVSWSEVAQHGSITLLNARVALQPGVRWLRASWAIDHLMTAYLTDSAPDTFLVACEDIHIQIRGARGALQFERIDPPTFAFRTALHADRTFGDAAEAALETDPGFDAGQALVALVSAGLVTGVTPILEGA